MGRDEDLGRASPPRRMAAKFIRQDLQQFVVQPIFWLLDANEWWWLRIFKHKEEPLAKL